MRNLKIKIKFVLKEMSRFKLELTQKKSRGHMCQARLKSLELYYRFFLASQHFCEFVHTTTAMLPQPLIADGLQSAGPYCSVRYNTM